MLMIVLIPIVVFVQRDTSEDGNDARITLNVALNMNVGDYVMILPTVLHSLVLMESSE